MGSATSKRNVGDSLPTTRCTNCQTVFELPEELLESTDTRVRWGECLCIFDARDGLIKADEAKTAAAGGKAGSKKTATKKTRSKKKTSAKRKAKSAAADLESPNALDVTYSDFDLFSEEADLPALAYLDETRDTPEFDFDAVELGDEETFSDTLFSHDVTIDADLPISERPRGDSEVTTESLSLPRADVDFAVDKAPEEPLIFKYEDPPSKDESATADAKARAEAARDIAAQKAERAQAKRIGHGDIDEDGERIRERRVEAISPELELETRKKSSGGMWVWVCGIFMMLGVLAATVVYPRWQTLDQDPRFRSAKIAACKVLKCQVNTRVDISELVVLKREIVEAPDRDEALIINIAILNKADFAQRYPVVETRMTDLVGRVVAKRAFKPSEYLDSWRLGDELNAGETVDINLTVNDPGLAARTHVLQLRELRLDCEPIEAQDGRQRWPEDCAEL